MPSRGAGRPFWRHIFDYVLDREGLRAGEWLAALAAGALPVR